MIVVIPLEMYPALYINFASTHQSKSYNIITCKIRSQYQASSRLSCNPSRSPSAVWHIYSCEQHAFQLLDKWLLSAGTNNHQIIKLFIYYKDLFLYIYISHLLTFNLFITATSSSNKTLKFMYVYITPKCNFRDHGDWKIEKGGRLTLFFIMYDVIYGV